MDYLGDSWGELSTREKAKVLGVAAGIALASVGVVLPVYNHFDRDEAVPEPPSPPAEAPPADDESESLPPSGEASNGPITPGEDLGPPVTLEKGFLVNGGVLVRSPQAVGVDCNEPVSGDTRVSSEKWFPVTLEAGRLLRRNFTPMIFLGEETEQPAIGFHALSDGWTVGYDQRSGIYTIHRFDVVQRPNQGLVEELPPGIREELLRGDAIGTPILEVTYEDLLRRGVVLNDERKQATIRINSGNVPPGAEGDLRVTLACTNGASQTAR
jgi:hypothetical protein